MGGGKITLFTSDVFLLQNNGKRRRNPPSPDLQNSMCAFQTITDADIVSSDSAKVSSSVKQNLG